MQGDRLSYRRVQVSTGHDETDKALSRIQDSIVESFGILAHSGSRTNFRNWDNQQPGGPVPKPSAGPPPTSLRVLQQTAVKAGKVNLIPHGAGREVSWFHGSLSVPATLSNAPNNPNGTSPNPDPTKYIAVTTTADVVVDFMVL